MKVLPRFNRAQISFANGFEKGAMMKVNELLSMQEIGAELPQQWIESPVSGLTGQKLLELHLGKPTPRGRKHTQGRTDEVESSH